MTVSKAILPVVASILLAQVCFFPKWRCSFKSNARVTWNLSDGLQLENPVVASMISVVFKK